MLNKPVVRESCYYRKLTDRGKDEPVPSFNEALIENLLGNTMFLTLSIFLFTITSEVSYDKLSSCMKFSLFLTGNRGLLPAPKARVQSEASESGNLIVYNGAMVDIGSMMQKLEKSEKAREEIEQKLMVQDAKMGMI